MVLEILICIIAGIICGIITGLLPGIHVNTVVVILAAFTGILLSFLSPLELGVFIVVMAITNSLLNFIPSIFLGAPESETALSVLPGHRMLLQGRGFEAVYLTVTGGFFGFLLILALVPVLLWLVPLIYKWIQGIIVFILILIVFHMIWTENKKVWAAFIFLISGTLGLVVLNSGIVQEPLFPLLSGLFGTSLLLISILSKTKVPKQEIKRVKINGKNIFEGIWTGTFAGISLGFLPGVGPAQATVLAMEINKNVKESTKNFLIAIGAISTVDVVVSLLAFFTISHPRSGAVIAIQNLLGTLTLKELLILLLAGFFAVSFASLFTIYLSRRIANYIWRIDYQKIALIVILFIAVLVPFISGIYGFLVLGTATAIGIIPNLVGVKKSLLMGVLLLPTILYFLGL